MFKNIFKSIFIAVLIIASAQIYFLKKTEATSDASSSSKIYSGGKITEEPSEKVSEQKEKCESAEICQGTCSNTWTDLTEMNCGKGTFTLNVYSPKGASTDYCVASSAKGNGKISPGKLIIDAYTQPEKTEIGLCTCVSGEYCEETTIETVYTNLARVTLFGTN